MNNGKSLARWSIPLISASIAATAARKLSASNTGSIGSEELITIGIGALFGAFVGLMVVLLDINKEQKKLVIGRAKVSASKGEVIKSYVLCCTCVIPFVGVGVLAIQANRLRHKTNWPRRLTSWSFWCALIITICVSIVIWAVLEQS